MSPDDGTVATPHERPPLLRGHFHTTFRVAAGEGFYCIDFEAEDTVRDQGDLRCQRFRRLV